APGDVRALLDDVSQGTTFVTTDLSLLLEDMADALEEAGQSPDVASLLASVGSGGEGLPTKAQEVWEAVLDQFGHRGVGELDISSPRYREAPDMLLEQVVSISGEKKIRIRVVPRRFWPFLVLLGNPRCHRWIRLEILVRTHPKRGPGTTRIRIFPPPNYLRAGAVHAPAQLGRGRGREAGGRGGQAVGVALSQRRGRGGVRGERAGLPLDVPVPGVSEVPPHGVPRAGDTVQPSELGASVLGCGDVR
ncbi:unnamed protein product, partial [Prorocentrum cordatum]